MKSVYMRLDAEICLGQGERKSSTTMKNVSNFYLLLPEMFLELCQVECAVEIKYRTVLLPMQPRTKAMIHIC